MQKILIIINDPAYGTEKAYNALRLANQLGKEYSQVEIRIFLMADAVTCAVAGQITPNGYYNIERMLRFSIGKGAKVKICGSCLDSRGLKSAPLIDGTRISTMPEMTEWVADSDKVVTF
ncbi:MAG: DsrE family protein [Cyclobacteriaceae bacterium]|nr:DsrE family protein [Cyclobacteriaceae bacterium]